MLQAAMIQGLLDHAATNAGEIDGMRMLELLAGLTVETCLLFDDGQDAMEATQARLADVLGCDATDGVLGPQALRPAYAIDASMEQGKALARGLFEQWLECAYEFHDGILFVIHNVLVRLEEGGQKRAESLRLFGELTARCMAWEIAAQELCDIVIDDRMAHHGWSLCEGFSGLSALAGHYLALLDPVPQGARPNGPDPFDGVAHAMTQEATRLGVPAGTDWRFGLAANDHPCTAPYELIDALDTPCAGLFVALGFVQPLDSAVACAKAAGRLLAVASGGSSPEIQPVIAKPLAMAAMTDTYRTVSRSSAAAAF